MNLATGIQNAIDYIEEHITDELDLAEVAKQAACSTYYFQKIFGILCGITVGEYIRNRRLTLAGSELMKADVRVIDTALKYGYESPESFTRAFTRFHGITPTEAKREGGRLRSFSRLKVQIVLKGGNSMDYKIIEKEEFTVLEKVSRHSVLSEEFHQTVPAFWDKVNSDGTVDTLLKYASDNTCTFGICYGGENAKTFEYSVAVKCASDTIAPNGYRISTIPARTWLVTECVGPMPEAIQKLDHDIYTELFPTINYKPTNEWDIEYYPNGDTTKSDYKSQIWVSVVTD